MNVPLFENAIIAEIGSVHDGSFGNALKAVELAAGLGADVIKFQTHIAEDETVRNAPPPPYFSGEGRFEYFKRTAFSRDQWRRLSDHATANGIVLLSSPFSHSAVDLLEDIGIQAYKIASGEVTNTPLLEHIARTGKPVFLSSGMSDWNEIDRAVEVLRGGGPLAIMQCTSAYPCPAERVGLNVIGEMKERYALPVGYSDHTQGVAAGAAAAAMGAQIVEKHLTFSRHMYGSDAALAMEPGPFRDYVAAIREVWAMMASPVDKSDLGLVREMKKIFEKSVVLERDVVEGHVLTLDDLGFKKPGDGIPAGRYREVVGRRTLRPMKADAKISFDDVSKI